MSNITWIVLGFVSGGEMSECVCECVWVSCE